MLIEKGAKVNAVNTDGISALDAASNVTEGNLKMIKLTKSVLLFCSSFYVFCMSNPNLKLQRP